jgi:uncharacterized protein (TIGR00288 family)
MKSHRVGEGERSLAVFIDFENMGLGFNNRRDRFEINKVLERLVEKGKIVAKKAYADWSRFGMYTAGLHEAAIELVEIPRRGMSGKNSADIRLVVDAIDLAYSKDHIDTFVIVSGDSDFSPLVSKLKELGKHVIGLGLVDATSDLLRDNCDEFIYYEDLDRAPIIPVAMNDQFPERKRKVFSLMLDSLLALRRENKEVIYSSMLKDTMKRKKPSFNEEYYGYRTFSELLEDAQREGLLEIEKHKSSGMYVVTRFGLEMSGGVTTPALRNGLDFRKPPEAPKSGVNSQPEPRQEKREAVRTRTAEKPPPQKPAPARPSGPIPAPDPIAPAAIQTPPSAVPPLPLAIPPSLEEEPSDNTRLLGRALVEEIDDLDDLDAVPSYSPARQAAKPAAKPAAKQQPKASKPAGAGKNKSEAAPAKQSRRAPSTKSPRSNQPERGRSEAKPSPAQAAAQSPAPVPTPAPPPTPNPPLDDDDFGAGLDT